MSKIYEALMRAEQERLESREEAAGTPSGTQPFDTAAPAELPLANVSLAPELPAEPADPGHSASANGFTHRLDLSRVQSHVWNPQLDKLPSLGKLGSGVEQFRRLRSRLFEFRDLNKVSSILVSSGLPREGKSFVAVNLAISFARHKSSRVLLIDGDMRRSSLHTLLGCENKPGLTTYLSGQAELMEVMQQPKAGVDGVPLPAGLASLTFIPSGDEGTKAADLSGHPRFKQLIQAATPLFDWIIVDSSPVNLVTDGVNLAHACDAVLLVARGGVTKFETAQRALMELKATNLVGVVLNGVEAPHVVGGYYDYDSYGTRQE